MSHGAQGTKGKLRVVSKIVAKSASPVAVAQPEAPPTVPPSNTVLKRPKVVALSTASLSLEGGAADDCGVKYKLGDCIGTGAFGQVFVGMDLHSGELIAGIRPLRADADGWQSRAWTCHTSRVTSCARWSRKSG